MSGRLLGYYAIHFRWLLRPNGILPAAKFTLRSSLAFSYFDSVTARHWNSGREANFAAWYWNEITELLQRAPPIFGGAAITLGIGPHSSLLVFLYFILLLSSDLSFHFFPSLWFFLTFLNTLPVIHNGFLDLLVTIL